MTQVIVMYQGLQRILAPHAGPTAGDTHSLTLTMPPSDAPSVDTVEFVEPHGKRVMLAVNYNHSTETIIAAIDHLAAEIEKVPDGSLRVVLDVKDGSADYKGTAHWETQLPLYERKVLKAAVVSSGMKRLVVSAIMTTARVAGMTFVDRVKLFDDRKAALKWVSED